MIKLKEIPLKEMKRVPGGSTRNGYYSHPLIQEGIYYLAKIDKRWYAGTFSKLWYGWNFNAVYDAGKQLEHGDHPKNAGWEQLYIIVDKEDIKSYPLILDVVKEAIDMERGGNSK